MAVSQTNRLLNLISPLGENQLLLTSLRGTEQLSRLFSFQLEMFGDNIKVGPADIIGKPVSFSVQLKDLSRRWFHGIVREIVQGETDGERQHFHAEIVPWLWFLTQTADCRIFQEKKTPEIIESIFKDLGYLKDTHYKVRLKGSYKKWDYCVQYRETDFNFVSRLMEQEGIFYYFEHSKDRHVLVLADDVSAYGDCPESSVDYPKSLGAASIDDHLTSWQHRFEFHSGGWAHTDYNFETPTTSLMAVTGSAHTAKLPDSSKFEIYDYPGEYTLKSEGSAEAKIRIQETEAGFEVAHASSRCKTFFPGGVFKVAEHHSSSIKGKSFLITTITHTAHEPLAYETGSGSSGQDYSNSFTCIPENVLFRPARKTPKPIVSGIQTAIVVGPKGEEIYTDKYGRVKVQFHWDREGKKDDKSSCWIRTSQSIAGRQWGFMAIPRIGQEVVIDFLEGDPDRPLIVGSVYNANQMPHYKLPDEKTRTYIKTNSTKGGTGYNELMFEDKKDDERVYIHSQKNMDVRVRNDSKARIYGNRHQIIGWEKDGKKGGDQREMIYEDQHLNVKRHSVEHIEGNLQLMVGNGEAKEGGQVDLVVEKNWNEQIDGDVSSDIKGANKVNIGGGLSQKIGGDLQTKVAGHVATEAGAMSDIHLKAGMNVTVECGPMGKLTLKGMGGFITIGPDGVTIQGLMVKINSGGAAGSGKGCKPEKPEKAQRAKPAKPEMAWDSKTGMKSSD
jgi:type VI secretion system secreted protein VgrG